MTSTARRWLTRATTGLTTIGLLLLGAPVALDGLDGANGEPATTAGPPAARQRTAAAVADLALVSHRVKHPQRKIKKYRVRRGDTAAGIATRYHAWTAQLIAINHASVFHPGEVIRIPVVVEAAHKCARHRHHFTGYLADNKGNRKGNGNGNGNGSGKGHGKGPGGKAHSKPPPKPQKHRPKDKHHAHRHPDHGWVHARASHAEVRRIILRRARHHGVNPNLALAISWQEAGWQQKRISSAGALGAMQVMPGTGRWMSDHVGRALNLRNLHDNVTAGVVLIKILRGQAGLRHAIAGYYQGLAGVRRYGMYDSTKHYVANVLALKRQIAHGWSPV